MRIYLDVCCLFRPFDEDRTQDRICRESDAISAIVRLCNEEGWKMLASEMIDFEMAGATNIRTAQRIGEFFPFTTERVMLTVDADSRAAFFQQNGVDVMDSYHLALAEAGKADVFLTTDDRLLRKAKRLGLRCRTENPETWLEEVLRNG